MKKQGVLLAIGLSAMMLLSGCCIQHTWTPATCTVPQTCTKCGKTEGEPFGHSWTSATCTTPKTCSACGETEGQALGHTPGTWTVTQEASLNQSGKKEQKCTVCGAIIDTSTITKEPEVNDDCFNFSGKEFGEYVNDRMNSSYSIVTSKSYSLGILTVCGIYYEGTAFSYYGYKENSEGCAEIIAVGGFTDDDEDSVIAIAAFMAEKIDASLDATKMLTNIVLYKTYRHNGIEYFYGDVVDGYPMLLFGPEEQVEQYIN